MAITLEKAVQEENSKSGRSYPLRNPVLEQRALVGMSIRQMLVGGFKHPGSVDWYMRTHHVNYIGGVPDIHHESECAEEGHDTLRYYWLIANVANAKRKKQKQKKQRTRRAAYAKAKASLELILSQAPRHEQLAILDFLRHKPRLINKPYDFEATKRLFELYLDARDNGERHPFEQLARESGIKYGSGAQRILARNGFGSLVGSHSAYQITTPLELQLIGLLHPTPLKPYEISHFIHWSKTPTSLSRILKGMGERPWISTAGSESSTRVVGNYLTAAEIYEAQDLEFSVEETAQLMELAFTVVNNYLRLRVAAEPLIKETRARVDLFERRLQSRAADYRQ